MISKGSIAKFPEIVGGDGRLLIENLFAGEQVTLGFPLAITIRLPTIYWRPQLDRGERVMLPAPVLKAFT